jgi:hypothetical protein
MATTTSSGTGLACSFCRKPPSAVATLVQGPGVFICNECVDLCTEIIANKPQIAADPNVSGWEQKMSDEDLLAHLPKVAAASAQVEQQLTTWVRQARSRGITWTRIGEALGMTRQSAWERFSGED